MTKKSLLFGACTALALAATAQALPLQKSAPVEKHLPARAEAAKVTAVRQLAKGLVEKEVVLSNGIRMKTVDAPMHHTNSVLNPEMSNPLTVAVPEGYVLMEDFEGWSGLDPQWLPDGWTVDHRDSPPSDRGWKITQPLNAYDYISSRCLTYEMFDNVTVDEWVITPSFEVTPGMELRWSTMTSPYFYDWTYMNDSFYLDKYEILNDLKVNVSIDGGKTWDLIYSHAEELINETDGNFFAMFDYTVRPFKASLDDYAGETVKIGFQVVGTNGNTSFIDDVSAGMPPTRTAYVRPFSNLFFGLSNTDENVPASIMVGPVFSPIRYDNSTPTKNAEFTWTYIDTEGSKTADTKNLSVTYQTDYTSASTTRNNMYFFPVLSGRSATTAPDEFTFPGFIQAGGRAEFERYFTDTQNYEIIDLGMTVIDPMTEGSATYADIALPYFGYNQESDMFWSRDAFGQNYTYDENNWKHLEGYADLFYSPEAPLVIEGIRTTAFGKISRDAKLKADIYLLNAAYVIPETPQYSATCTGNDITIIDRSASNDFLSFNFKFEEPVVISKSVAPYFVVCISGFRDAENVEYFSPEMSNYTNPNNLGLGWILTQMCYEGELYPASWSSVTNWTGDNQRVAFYIMLDAYFPWLEGNTAELEIKPGYSASVKFDSYLDGSKLSFEGLPDWLQAKAVGRYAATTVTFSASEKATGSATVTVKGPGVSKQVKVTAAGNDGIDDITVDSAGNDAVIFTIDGRQVDVKNAAPGIYLKRQGDKVEKIRL